MKKFAPLFAFAMFISIAMTAQPQLTWQFANAEVINAGTQFQFDVEVKADAAGTYHRDLQIYFDYNTAGFGSDIVAGGNVSVSDLTLMENHYFVVNSADNTNSKFAVITEANNEMSQVGSATYFNAMPTTFTGLLRITIDIADNSETAGIVFDEALMNGGQYHQSTGAIDALKYTDPCLYDNDLAATKLSTVYGNITYDNGASTPLSDVTVTLMDGGSPVTTDVSDASGDYNLSSMDDGNYTLESSTTKAWGGLSMNDVQFARQKVTNQPPGNGLTGLRLLAADVDQSGGAITMNDVQFMRQVVTSSPPGFAPFWIFEEPSVNVIGGVATQSYMGICGGDTDGSYIPPAK